jgi:hypothetical protein
MVAFRAVLSDGDLIRNLLGRYCDLMDAGDWEGIGLLFAAGALSGPDGSVLAQGAEEVAGFYERGTQLHDGSPRTKHLVLNTVLELDADEAMARSSYLVLQALEGESVLRPMIAGRYVDSFERADDGGWRWRERRFAVDLAGDLSQHLTWSPP